MEPPSHRAADFIENFWPIISGIAVTILATMKLWWHTHKETKTRIRNLEILADNLVTKDELHECRDDVRQVEENNLEKIYNRMDDHARENAKQHQDIMQQIIRLHGGNKQ